MIRPDLDLMRPIPIVEGRVPRRQTAGKTAVALARARQPPSAHLAWLPRVAQVHDDPDLIVLRIGRTEVPHARRQMRELAVHEPQVVHAARVRT